MNYSSLHITTNFHIIKTWVEERGGKPAKNLSSNSELTSLSIFYPGEEKEHFEFVSWTDFFDEFANANLAFMFQVDVNDIEHSMFYKFVRREDYVDEINLEEEEEDVVFCEHCGALQM